VAEAGGPLDRSDGRVKTALQVATIALFTVWTAVGIWLLVFAWEDRREQQAIREREDAARRYQSVEPDDVEYGVGA
jgi:hypothetical protein